jgi:hypothetical protein
MMWTIRFVLLGLFIAFLSSSGYFLSRRREYQNILENGVFNLALVFFLQPALLPVDRFAI